MTREENRQRERTREVACDQRRHHLGVGLRLEFMTPDGELILELLKILDDAVMDDGDAVGRDGMRIGLVGRAMRRPTRVADADLAADRLRGEALDQFVELALGAPA